MVDVFRIVFDILTDLVNKILMHFIYLAVYVKIIPPGKNSISAFICMDVIARLSSHMGSV